MATGGETRAYRAPTREGAERAYHADARRLADDGYVPASEDWSVALGQQVLTVGYIYAPEQVPGVLAALTSPVPSPAPAPTSAPPPPVLATPTSRSRGRGVILLLVVIGLAVVAWQSGILGRLTASGGSAGNIPPSGEIWFGTSFDPGTFAVNGRTTSFRVGSSAALVAQLPHAVSSGQINMRVSYNGTVIVNQNMTVQGGGELVGTTLSAFVLAGTYLYEVTDLGGNVLAKRTLTITE